jgi:hypothetical protein
MMTMERTATKIIDLISDGRYSARDMDDLGFHIINLSFRQVQKNALCLADAIMYHHSHPFSGDVNGQDTLF